jgi:DNA-binding XRE family transcriptional regulator
MVASTQIKHRWDTREYADIAAVRFEDGRLHVTFLDGNEVSLSVAVLEGYGVENHEWPEARSEVYHISVPTRHGEVEIPWDVIRALTDEEFGAFLDDHAVETARRVGIRLRVLREHRGMSAPQLAQRIGVPVETINHLESGDLPGNLALQERVLRALGTTSNEALPSKSVAARSPRT